MGSKVSSEDMSVRPGQGTDEVLVSQAVWDYLAAAGRSLLVDFQHRQGTSAGIVRRGERGGCCAVRLQPLPGYRDAGGARLTDAPVSNETRKAFIELCCSARKEMSKLEGTPRRKRALLPCVLDSSSEGSVLPPDPAPPRRSQRQLQRFRPPADQEARSVLQDHTPRTEAESAARPHGEDDGGTCSICMGDMVERTMLERCGHAFCRCCLEQAFKVKKACPVCRLVYGQLIGNQPINGTMMVERDPDLELPGHEGFGCICIIYCFPPGLQAPEHPNPGVRYPGTDRVAYLPDSPEGNRVLGLLRRAFEQRLIFTIGTSMTTGLQNVITWNDIHHKTSIFGGPRCFGFPDPTYLVRVTEELREKGITAD